MNYKITNVVEYAKKKELYPRVKTPKKSKKNREKAKMLSALQNNVLA